MAARLRPRRSGGADGRRRLRLHQPLAALGVLRLGAPAELCTASLHSCVCVCVNRRTAARRAVGGILPSTATRGQSTTATSALLHHLRCERRLFTPLAVNRQRARAASLRGRS